MKISERKRREQELHEKIDVACALAQKVSDYVAGLPRHDKETVWMLIAALQAHFERWGRQCSDPDRYAGMLELFRGDPAESPE